MPLYSFSFCLVTPSFGVIQLNVNLLNAITLCFILLGRILLSVILPNVYLRNVTKPFCFRLCFVKLKLLLLAIEVKADEGTDNKISINPRGTKLPANTVGFFIAQSAEEVKR